MDSTTNGYFPVPVLGDGGATKKAEFDAIFETTDGVLKDIADGNLPNTILPATGNIYLGTVTTEGSWRIRRSGNDLQFERYESGSWVAKGAVTA